MSDFMIDEAKDVALGLLRSRVKDRDAEIAALKAEIERLKADLGHEAIVNLQLKDALRGFLRDGFLKHYQVDSLLEPPKGE